MLNLQVFPVKLINMNYLGLMLETLTCDCDCRGPLYEGSDTLSDFYSKVDKGYSSKVYHPGGDGILKKF